MRKLLFFLSLWLLQAVVAGAASFTYTTNAGAITITGYTGAGGDVVIPSRINSLPVASIGAGAFSNVISLTGVTIPAGIGSLGNYAFSSCTNLSGVYFAGNAPATGTSVFKSDSLAVAYYLPLVTGWSSPFAGIKAVLWDPVIQTSGTNFGIKNNLFGFNITGPTNIAVEVETCTNLASPVWVPLEAFGLTNGLVHFTGSLPATGAGSYYGLSFPPIAPLASNSSPTPVLRWKFDEGSGTNVMDSTGNGYNGRLASDTSAADYPTWVAGPNGNEAISCEVNENSGTSTAYVIGSTDVAPLGNSQHASISVWIYEGGNQDYAEVGFAQDPSGNNGIFLDANDNENLTYFIVSSGGVVTDCTAGPGLLIGWYNWIMTFDGTQTGPTNVLKGYLNGVPQELTPVDTSYSSALSSAANLGFLSVGKGFGGDGPNGFYYAGEYADMQVFNVTLTAAQAQSIFNAGAQ
jgi:hypothetical protein